MEPRLRIREMTADDLSAVKSLYIGMYEEQKSFGMVMELNVGEVDHLLEAQLKSKMYVSQVAELNGDIVGFAVGALVRYPKKFLQLSEEASFIGFIHELFVAAEHRGAGLAGRLLSKMEEQFKEHGVDYVELHVLNDNELGQGFWEANGFRNVLQVKFKRL
ncbi:N-acetyltransferase family protein [Paenibacillus sp. strain BS8-2]